MKKINEYIGAEQLKVYIAIAVLVGGMLTYYFTQQSTQARELDVCKTKIDKQERDFNKLYDENKQEHKEIIIKLDKILLK